MPDDFRGLGEQLAAVREQVPGVLAKMRRAKRALEDESRRSLGPADAVPDNPLKMYFDLK